MFAEDTTNQQRRFDSTISLGAVVISLKVDLLQFTIGAISVQDVVMVYTLEISF